MAREDVQGVLTALAQAHLRGIERTRVQNEQVHQQQQEQLEQQRIDVEKERVKQEHEHQQAILKAAQSTHKVQYMEVLQKIGAGIQAGHPVPGMVSHDVPGTGGAAQLHVINDEEGKPIASVMLPSQEEFAKQQAATETTLLEPKIKGRMREIEAQKSAEYEKTQMQKEADDARNEATRKSQEMIARGHDAARIAAAKLTHQGTAIDSDVAKTYVEGSINGDHTLEELTKAIPDKGQRSSVVNAVIGSGANFFTPKQKLIKADFASAAQLIPQFDQANAILAANPVAARNPMTQEGQEYRQIQAQIKEKLINSLTAFGQAGRLSDPRVKAMNDAFNAMTTVNPFVDPIKLNTKAKTEFVKYLNNVIDQQLSTVSKAQRDKVKLDLGLFGQEPAAQPQAQRPPLSQFYQQPQQQQVQ